MPMTLFDATNSSLDVIVIAGGHGFSKPYLNLGDEPLVVKAVRATLDAKGIGHVYVVGDVELLHQSLLHIHSHSAHRVTLVPEGIDILDNCSRVFFSYVLPSHGIHLPEGKAFSLKMLRQFCLMHPEAANISVLIIASDLPFITSKDVEEFVLSIPTDAAVVLGLIDCAGFARMQRVLGKQFHLEQWKLGSIPLRRWAVRPSNLWFVRPLRVDPFFYSLVSDVYAHRWLLERDGTVRWRNWLAIVRSVISHCFHMRHKVSFFRGMANLLPTVLAAAVARFVGRVSKWFAWPLRMFLGQHDVEFIASLLLGAQARIVVTSNIRPGIDIDVEDCYNLLAANNEEIFRVLENYFERVHKVA